MDANVKARARRSDEGGLLVLASWSATLATLTVRAQRPDEWRTASVWSLYGFRRGSSQWGRGKRAGERGRGPVRQVRISRGFYMGKFELTQGQWREVMEATRQPTARAEPTAPRKACPGTRRRRS